MFSSGDFFCHGSSAPELATEPIWSRLAMDHEIEVLTFDEIGFLKFCSILQEIRIKTHYGHRFSKPW